MTKIMRAIVSAERLFLVLPIGITILTGLAGVVFDLNEYLQRNFDPLYQPYFLGVVLLNGLLTFGFFVLGFRHQINDPPRPEPKVVMDIFGNLYFEDEVGGFWFTRLAIWIYSGVLLYILLQMLRVAGVEYFIHSIYTPGCLSAIAIYSWGALLTLVLCIVRFCAVFTNNSYDFRS